MTVLVVHNLKQGGGCRRLREQTARLDVEVIELTLGTATPVTDTPIVVPYAPRPPLARRALRAPLRYSDAARLALAWQRFAARARALRADVVFANPCQFLHSPPSLLRGATPSLYYCDEAAPHRSRARCSGEGNPRTRAVYGAL
ncbi:MAG TPA: hypothetical protein VFD90_18535 [Gaiellales bacterium]|nr:hypothetical protein [Gaiellales bacterium]